MLKIFYLIFGIALIIGTLYLAYRRLNGLDGESSTIAIMLCSIVGVLCFVMYAFVDKLMPPKA
jgi:hypothetical protein